MKEELNTTILPGSRVLVFDPRLFINDEKTPLSMTMKPATVVSRYGRKEAADGNLRNEDWIYPDLVDVLFDHRTDNVSKAHFTQYVEEIK